MASERRRRGRSNAFYAQVAGAYRQALDQRAPAASNGQILATHRCGCPVVSQDALDRIEEAHATELDRMAAECERLERERDIANAQAARLAERIAALTT
jgi:hypothetical protein